MEYIEGLVAAVPTESKAAYIEHARRAGEVFRSHGALRLVECWGDDVPPGEVTSFPRAVQCRDDETVVFSWIVWPSREARNAGMAAIMGDAEMSALMEAMPFDGGRLIYGGFEVILDE